MSAPGTPPLLAGPRLRLRAMRPDDVPAWFAMQSDPIGMRYWSYPPLTRVEQSQELFERNAAGAGDGALLPWAIALNADDAMIGTCTLFAIDAAHRRAMIGYALAHAHWGNGYAQEALRLALGHAFGARQLHRVEADIDPRNVASVRLVERLGFVREGLLRERWFVGDDVQDSVIYALLARDFAGR
ncbi:MAG TPA: GNAT family protein [Caldimonas sp.]|nr:GNAT family protein [Caldimonas sp.]